MTGGSLDKDVGVLEGRFDGLEKLVTQGFINIHARLDAGKDANIKAQDRLFLASQDHEHKDDERHKEMVTKFDEYKSEVEKRLKPLEDDKQDRETAVRIAKWMAAFAVTVSSLPWVGKALAWVGDKIP